MNNYIFRGKRKNNGEWVYGFYIETVCGTEIYEHEVIEHKDCGSSTHIEQRHSVLPETVGMWTGREDKNGVRVFEGDKAKVRYLVDGDEYSKITTVKWNSNKCGFSPWTWEYLCEGCECNTELLDIEVIGNIHTQEGE